MLNSLPILLGWIYHIGPRMNTVNWRGDVPQGHPKIATYFIGGLIFGHPSGLWERTGAAGDSGV
jgi:hypothetical protein